MWNISPVSNINLFPSIINSRIRISGIFQLDDTQRYTIYKQKHIRSTIFFLTIVCIFHCKLIHYTEDILIPIIKLNKRYHSWQSILRRKLNTIYHPAIYFMQSSKITFRTYKTDIIIYLCHLVFCQIRVGVCYKLLEIISNQYISFCDTRDIIARRILPTFRF